MILINNKSGFSCWPKQLDIWPKKEAGCFDLSKLNSSNKGYMYKHSRVTILAITQLTQQYI